MKTIITLGIIILNIFSIIITVKMLSGQDLTKKIAYVLGGEIGIFIVSIILYAISGSGVLDSIHQGAKWYMILTMTPVNTLLMYCPAISSINKREKEERANNKMSILIIIDIAIMIIEVIYVKNIQLGIANFGN